MSDTLTREQIEERIRLLANACNLECEPDTCQCTALEDMALRAIDAEPRIRELEEMTRSRDGWQADALNYSRSRECQRQMTESAESRIRELEELLRIARIGLPPDSAIVADIDAALARKP